MCCFGLNIWPPSRSLRCAANPFFSTLYGSFFEFSSTAPALTGQGAVEPQAKKTHLGPGFYPALFAALLRCARRLRANWAHYLLIWGNGRLSGPLNLVLTARAAPKLRGALSIIIAQSSQCGNQHRKREESPKRSIFCFALPAGDPEKHESIYNIWHITTSPGVWCDVSIIHNPGRPPIPLAPLLLHLAIFNFFALLGCMKQSYLFINPHFILLYAAD